MQAAQKVKLNRLRLHDFPLLPVEHDATTRAGARTLQLATSGNIATALGVNMPEVLVAALEVTADGEIDAELAQFALSEFVGTADAVLVGPAMPYNEYSADLMLWIIGEITSHATLVIDGPIVHAQPLCTKVPKRGFPLSIPWRVVVEMAKQERNSVAPARCRQV
ncbi:MAG: hypothetical protein ABI120_10945 [Gemmatimonadaceae bacterium]